MSNLRTPSSDLTRRRGRQAVRYALLGASYGLLFPIGATLLSLTLAQRPLSLSEIVAQQTSNPLLWLVDSAPLVLGIFAALAGLRQDRLQQLNLELNERRAELDRAAAELERRVEERTQQLDAVNRELGTRANRLEIIGRLSQSIAQLQDPDELLREIPALITQQLGYYHVGLFLLDESGRFAVLQSASSAGGQRMLARGHKLRVGVTGVVGNVARSGVPRVVRDVQTDSTFYDNPDLPDTRAEAAVPLSAGDRIIGVLDLQSTQVDAFGTEEIDALRVLSNQAAIALENARRLASSQAALSSISDASRDELRRFSEQGGSYGISLSVDGRMTPARPSEDFSSMRAISTGRYVVSEGGEAGGAPLMAFPVKVRDQVVGLIRVEAASGARRWTPDEVELVQGFADRAGAALENTGLLAATQRQAEKERIIREISENIGASTQVDTIVQAAARELSRALGGSEVMVQIEPGAMAAGRKAEEPR